MRILIFASAAAFALCGAASILAAQQPPVIQTQANPPGAGIPSETPPNPPSADTPVPPAMPADPSYQAGPYKGALTPPPTEAMAKTYPPCTSKLQDSCVNPGEADPPPETVMPKHRPKSRRVRHSHRH